MLERTKKSTLDALVIDGPVGSELTKRGAPTSGPEWSARALVDSPNLVHQVHLDYAALGVGVHRTNTFRTRERTVGSDWRRLATTAIDIARDAAHRTVPKTRFPSASALANRFRNRAALAGSLGPLEDCYRPDLTPDDAKIARENEPMIELFLQQHADLLFVETIPNPREAIALARLCTATTLPTWVSLTPGPDGVLIDPESVHRAASDLAQMGVEGVFVNCVAASRAMPFVEALARVDCVVKGIYANAATWFGEPVGSAQYVDYSVDWARAGINVVSGCCGTGPGFVAAMINTFGD